MGFYDSGANQWRHKQLIETHAYDIIDFLFLQLQVSLLYESVLTHLSKYVVSKTVLGLRNFKIKYKKDFCQ